MEDKLIQDIKDKLPALMELTPDQEERINRALGKLATGMMLAATLEPGSAEYTKLQTEMSYAKTTLNSLKGIKWAQLEKAGKEVVEEAFQFGVRALLSSLL